MFRPLLLCLMMSALPALAETQHCTLLGRLGATDWAYQSGGACSTRHSPASSFKLPLALMGFDSGLLQGPAAPAVPYDPFTEVRFRSWAQTTTPARWLRHSVIWYSRWVTQRLGMMRLQAYVDAFDYGNRDVSGEPGANNGLTHAWLGSSLEISPNEQGAFLRRLWQGDLPVSAQSVAALTASLPRFDTQTPGLTVVGKTGTAWIKDARGHRTGKQLGWFVGRADFEGEAYVVVQLIHGFDQPGEFGGPHAREIVRAHLGDWLRIVAD